MALISAAVITVILIVIAGITILNVFTMLRLGRARQSDMQPKLSVLIPARNEAAVIEGTVTALLAQGYRNFELILLDDNSTDGTADLVRQAAEGDPRLRVINGQPLPDGWAGKNWACHQLSQAAGGEYLVFTDADVRWGDGALQALVNELADTRADVLTIWSTQDTETLGERWCVSLMALVVLGYLPHLAVNYIPHPVFAAANGQCLTLKREAYDRIGGHAAVRQEIVEDIRMAQIAKANGLRLRMTDGNGRVRCRMYRSWSDVRNGYAKNITAGYGDSLWGLLAGSVFHWLVFLWPWVWLGWSLIAGESEQASWAAVLVALGVLVRALTAAATRQRVIDAIFMPVSVVLMTVIAAQSAYWYMRYGGPRWKGRTIIRHKRRLSRG
jgi:chlorobactene glucosyltransferase